MLITICLVCFPCAQKHGATCLLKNFNNQPKQNLPQFLLAVKQTTQSDLFKNSRHFSFVTLQYLIGPPLCVEHAYGVTMVFVSTLVKGESDYNRALDRQHPQYWAQSRQHDLSFYTIPGHVISIPWKTIYQKQVLLRKKNNLNKYRQGKRLLSHKT